MKLLFHSKTPTVAPLKFGNGINNFIARDYLSSVRDYLSILGLNLNHASKRGPVYYGSCLTHFTECTHFVRCAIVSMQLGVRHVQCQVATISTEVNVLCDSWTSGPYKWRRTSRLLHGCPGLGPWSIDAVCWNSNRFQTSSCLNTVHPKKYVCDLNLVANFFGSETSYVFIYGLQPWRTFGRVSPISSVIWTKQYNARHNQFKWQTVYINTMKSMHNDHNYRLQRANWDLHKNCWHFQTAITNASSSM